MKIAVLQFPASNCDQDALYVLQKVLGVSASLFWHKENSLRDAQAVIIPGGFSYGDYLRTGAIARFSPIMQQVKEFAAQGGPVLGICNGFQILCEAGLLPGALIRNRSLKFCCESVYIKTNHANSPFTNRLTEGQILRLPIAHGEGCYYAEESTLAELRQNRQILWQYADASGALVDSANPNGSLANIAGICNAAGNVAGLMPHPERASEDILGGSDGRLIFDSILHWHSEKSRAAA